MNTVWALSTGNVDHVLGSSHLVAVGTLRKFFQNFPMIRVEVSNGAPCQTLSDFQKMIHINTSSTQKKLNFYGPFSNAYFSESCGIQPKTLFIILDIK
jgi:hypothetical protein